MDNKKIRMIIVDDSPFSRTILAEMLKENGIEVVGEADSLESAVEVYNNTKPDLVSMDIAMPGADGFECSRAILINDPNAKIIINSSMKDEETEAEARRIGIVGYVQKPVEEKVIMSIINNILAPDELFEKLQGLGIETFKEALSQNITSMTKEPVTLSCNECIHTEFTAHGITSVIGIIGQYTGNMILGLSMETAEKISKTLMRRDPRDKEEVLAMAAELANIIAGISCSMLNKKDRAFGLRVSPPSIFHGEVTQISPTIELQGCCVESTLGAIHLWVGFKKGHVLWM